MFNSSPAFKYKKQLTNKQLLYIYEDVTVSKYYLDIYKQIVKHKK